MKSFNTVKDALDNILQKNIEIVFNGKVIRKGIFILYSIKDYHLTIILKTPKSNKTYDMLYPFNVEVHNNERITMDYKLDNLQIENQRLIDCIDSVDTTGASKFLNHELHINIK